MERAPHAPLPPWGDDALSAFMADADHNERASALNLPQVYAVQQRAAGPLGRICELIESDPGDPNLLVPRLLVNRSRSAMLGAMRSAMSGQAFEAQPALRLAIEHAWYALHVARDPAPPARAELWWGRGGSPEATQACRNEFKVENVRRTHEGLDAPTAGAMKGLYDDTIHFGAHPNQGGVAASLRVERSRPDAVTIGIGVLHPDPLVTVAALKAAVDVTVGAAKTVGLIYPERFRIAGVDDEIQQLVRHSREVFTRQYAEALLQLRAS
jgi:hypothetical protein